MADLRHRLRELDSVTPPDLWDEIRSGTPRAEKAPVARRIGVAAVALLVFAGGLYVVAREFGGHHLWVGPLLISRPHHPVQVSAVSMDGYLPSAVWLPGNVVQPGGP